MITSTSTERHTARSGAVSERTIWTAPATLPPMRTGTVSILTRAPATVPDERTAAPSACAEASARASGRPGGIARPSIRTAGESPRAAITN